MLFLTADVLTVNTNVTSRKPVKTTKENYYSQCLDASSLTLVDAFVTGYQRLSLYNHTGQVLALGSTYTTITDII